MTDKDTQDQIDAMMSRLKIVEDQVATPSHYHNGFDSNQIAFNDIYQKKLYIRHTLYGADAALSGSYGTFFIVPVKCLVTNIQEVHESLGISGGAVTVNIEKLTSTTAPGGGSGLLPTPFDLKASINTVRTGTITTTSSTKSLAIGDRLALLLSGTPTSVAGMAVHIELTY